MLISNSIFLIYELNSSKNYKNKKKFFQDIKIKSKSPNVNKDIFFVENNYMTELQ